MNHSTSAPLDLSEGRFARFEAIEWWDQKRLKNAKVLVIGAGALGNELLKNLALLGLGHVVVVDKDRIEKSNLSRSVLFRESDEGRPKAVCAAEMMSQICPETKVHPIVGDVLSDVGLGFFNWADVIGGALDNREARVFVNAACARLGKQWIDGGIEVLNGIARGFAPPQSACYECTMSRADWKLINQRRSCSLLARRAFAQRGAPTTPTTASVIGGIQAQEIVKILHGLNSFKGRGFFFDGLNHTSYPIEYPINPECGWHEPPPPLKRVPSFTGDTLLADVAKLAEEVLGGLDAIDFSREIIKSVYCGGCGRIDEIWRPVESITDDQAVCRACGAEMTPDFLHSVDKTGNLLGRSLRQAGLPAWDTVWPRFGDKIIGIEVAGDNPFND